MVRPNAGWDDYRRLVDKSSETICVSLYQPAHRTGPERRQDPIRFKNLLTKAEQQLGELLGAQGRAERFLQPARELQTDDEFWQHQDQGLAVFLCDNPVDENHGRLLTGSLAHEVPERVLVGPRFLITPLLPAMHDIHRFFVVTVSTQQVRLFEATRRWIREVSDPRFEEAVKVLSMWDDERSLQYRMSSPQRSAGRQSAPNFHGHEDADHRERILTELRLVNGAVVDHINDSEVPLVFAGVEELFPLYREVNTHRRLAGEFVHGNADRVQLETLRAAAWNIVEPILTADAEQAVDEYRQLSATNRVSTDLEQILPAAAIGAVDTLLVAAGAEISGTFDAESHTVRQITGEGSEDLINRATLEALANGGTVYSLPKDKFPADAPVAAIFRFAPALP